MFGDPSEIVSRHVAAILADARRYGMKREDVTIALAAHAACAALTDWSPRDLYALIDIAREDADTFVSKPKDAVVIPFPDPCRRSR
jgi:hypothetical protein